MCRIPTEEILAGMCREDVTYSDLIKSRDELQKEIRKIEKKITHVSRNNIVVYDPLKIEESTADIPLDAEYAENLYLLSGVLKEIYNRLCNNRIKFSIHTAEYSEKVVFNEK